MDYKTELLTKTETTIINHLVGELQKIKTENQKLKDELSLYRKETHQIFIEPQILGH